MLTTLIPTKNHGIYLDRLLSQFILTDDSPVTQLFICNDGSTDDTETILQKYDEDPRVRLFKNSKSIGAIPAILSMFQHVQTPYVSILSSDDFFYPAQMARLLNEMIRNESCIGFGKYCIQDESHLIELQHPGWRARLIAGADDFRALLAFDHYMFLGTTIFRKDLLPSYTAKGLPFDLSIERLVSADGLGEFRGHDWNLALELSMLYPHRIYFLDEYIGVFRKVSMQLSSEDIYVRTGRSAYEMALLILRYLPDYSLRQRFMEIPLFQDAVRNLFNSKINAISAKELASKNFQHIYKPSILAADVLLDSLSHKPSLS
jgi:glycosyltransferase involved in cell wall biosynthesis